MSQLASTDCRAIFWQHLDLCFTR